MKITDSRANDILRWLDDETGNHALLFEKMTLHRDAAALIRQLQAELQDAWQAGLDAGREQGRGKDHTQQPPSVPVGVETSQLADELEAWAKEPFVDLTPMRRMDIEGFAKRIRALTQQPAAVDGADRDDARRYRALVATGKYVPAMREGWGLACGSAKASKAELDAAADALTAQPGGSDNDR